MRTSVIALLCVLILISPVVAKQYGPATFTDSGITVEATISGPDMWSAPFDEVVSLSLSVAPALEDVLSVNVTEVTLSINRYTASSGYAPIAAETVVLGSPATGTDAVNLTVEVELEGVSNSPDCYFAIAVRGSYFDGNSTVEFLATSPDDLIGPFAVAPGLSSPVSQVGIVVTVIFGVLVVLGAYGVKKAKSPPSRPRGLLDE